jgi:hypothetical protein
MTTPAEQVAAADRISLPAGGDELFSGYGVMGQPFASGHVLAMRRFPHSSIGAGYTSVWHCDPEGRWTMWSDVDPSLACPRYFGPALTAARQCNIDLTWSDPWTFDVRIEGVLEWHTRLDQTPSTALMSAIASRLPAAFWRRDAAVSLMSRMAGRMLGAGRLRMNGRVPSEQWFKVALRSVWATTDVEATVHGESLGTAGPIEQQRQMGGFPVPNRGLFAIGQASFETYDPDRHLHSASSPD